MQPYQQRVVDEQAELVDRIDKLKAFVGGPFYFKLEETDRWLLLDQLDAMEDYSGILHKRISRFV